MNQRQLGHVTLVFAAAILARVLLFDSVGMWGDFGFYTYNSKLVLEGQKPFIDFLGRSPLFIYSYAAVRSVVGHPVVSLRSFIMVWWVLAGGPVYGIARHIGEHRAGLSALVLYLLSPFALVYGMWANTQGLAVLLAVTAVYLVLRYDTTAGYSIAGALLGLAFLSRRSVIVVLPALILFLGYEQLRKEQDITPAMKRIAGAVSAFFFLAWIGYLALAEGNLGTAWALAKTHGVNLFLSVGRGGFPLLGVEAPPVTNEIGSGRIPIFNDLCQMCGRWTARTFAKTLILVTPVAGIYAYYLQDLTDHYFIERDVQYLFGTLGALALYAAFRALLAGYSVRATTVLALTIFVVVAYRSEALQRDILYSRGSVLLLIVLFGFAAGYLYRNRLLHAYYFLDLWPFFSALGGVLYARSTLKLGRALRVALAVAVIIAVLTSAGGAHPLTNIVLDDNEDGWFTTGNIDEYGDDLDARTEPGDEVLVTNPTYLTNSHARMVDDNARIHYLYVNYAEYGDDGPAGPMYRSVIDGLETGRIKYVILGDLAEKLLRYNESSRVAFQNNYCLVDTDGFYAKTNASLYKFEPEDSDCTEGRPHINATA